MGARPALQNGSRVPSGTARSGKVSGDEKDSKAGTSTAITNKKPKTKGTPKKKKKPPQESTKIMETKPASALQKGSKTPSGTAQSRSMVSSDKEENKAGTSPGIADKKPKTKSTPAKKPPQEDINTRETKLVSGKKVLQDGPKPALQKGSIAPSGTAQLSIVSGDKKESKAGTSTSIADRKPTTESKLAKKSPQEGTKTMVTKPASAMQVLQDGPKPGASTSKKSTSGGGNKKSRMGINVPKKPAKKRKAKEEEDAPNNKTRKIKLTLITQEGVSVNSNASESGTSRGNKMTGQEINIIIN